METALRARLVLAYLIGGLALGKGTEDLTEGTPLLLPLLLAANPQNTRTTR